jgi:Putative beta barrel porin-7 (BBP7)
MAKNQNNRLEVSYGARFLKLYDEFDVTGSGGILDASFWDTSINNQIVGPQLGAKWTNQRQRWTFEAAAKCLLGYNIEDWHQEGGIGRGFIPGALNRPLYAQPTYFNHAQQLDDFSPVGELRVSTAYYVTESLKFQLGYTGMYVGNIRRAAPSVLYSLPDMGYREAGTQNLLSNGFDFGVEVVY